MSVLPFRLSEPLAIVSLAGANWQVAMFGQGDCNLLGVLTFAIVDQVVLCVVDMHVEAWRLIFQDGAAGIRRRAAAELNGWSS